MISLPVNTKPSCNLSFFFPLPHLIGSNFFMVTTHGGVALRLGETNLRAGLRPGFLRGSRLGRAG